MNIAELIEILDKVTDKQEIHEYDTIERFVVPIIEIAEWDIHSIRPLILRRGNQDKSSHHRRFDIELYKLGEDAPRFIFECKKLGEQIDLIGKGDAININDHSDFVRQIKNDCLSGSYCFKHGWSIPILTNGEKWVIFKGEFTDQDRANEAVSNGNYSDFVEAEASLKDAYFEGRIITILKDKGAVGGING